MLIDVVLELYEREAEYFEQSQDFEDDSSLLIVVGAKVLYIYVIVPLEEEILLQGVVV